MATILIVDDLSADRESLVRLLRDQGHRLIEAVDGKQGLAAIEAEHPDMVITDMLMPVMDGFEFARQLRLDPRTGRIPVVFHTAPYSEREAKALTLSNGVSYVLTKPATPEEVLKLVGRVLSGESEVGMPPEASPLTTEFRQEHLRLLTDTLSEKADDLRITNTRLRALINIVLELASERDADRLLESVCVAVRDLFGATYVTLGILSRDSRTVLRVITCGTDADNWIETGDAVPGILGTVVTARRALRGDNPGGSSGALHLPARHPDVEAFIAAPIASPVQVYGWLCLVGNEGRTFSEDDEHLIVALSGQVGRIYEHGYSYAVAKKRAEELEHEVSERCRAEATLRHERDQTQRYLDTAEVILLALDIDARITLINRAGCHLLGRTESELIGRDWIETCLPVRTWDAIRATFRRVIGGDLSIVENTILTKSGEERFIEWRTTLLRDEVGRVTGTFSSGADITERNRTAEALRVAEERMRFALEATGVGIWDMDFTTGALRWSEILESQYGLPPGTFGGTFEAFVECVHPQDRDALRETMAKANQSGDFSLQHRALWPDGTVRWLSGAGRIHRDEHNAPVRGVGISLDVTERRTLEAQYQQAQKMEAIGRLAGGVAHDFNNLLTAILGYCELLLADLDPGDPRQKDIGEIQKAGMSAAGLTRQLLAFSRKEIIEPTLLDLNVVVAEVRTMLGRLIREDVKVLLGLRPEPAIVKADRGQVEQIVLNLAVNARDAMPTGGTLTIEIGSVDLDEHYAAAHFSVTPGSYMVLTVSDTGTGMTPEVQTRVFEPFFTTKEPGRGTGLGLATVHGIVTRCGGSVTIYSEVGRGTSISVYLPAADVTEMVVEALPPAVHPRAGTQTVLVVEDAEGLRQLTRRLLERQGYSVLVAANADEALRLCEGTASIDVLLTDVVMPGASGPELTRRLLEQRPGLKVIYMSGYTEDAIVQHGVLNHAIAFLHKPFTAETLGRKISDVLDR